MITALSLLPHPGNSVCSEVRQRGASAMNLKSSNTVKARANVQLYNNNYQEFCLVQLDNADLSAGSKQQDRPAEFKMATNYFYIYVVDRKT